MVDNEFPGLAPINFFQLAGECKFLPDGTFGKNQKAYTLPNTSDLCSEERFAEVVIGWCDEGIHLVVHIDQPFKESSYPNITQGDSVEIFIDTRDVKTSGFNTRFCHHFFFLPEPLAGHIAGEVTHFRSEESHPYCEPELLKVTSMLKSKHYQMKIFIPSECLVGYDPKQFNRIGFAYRINRPDGPSQHYSCISDEFRVEQQPSLWSSMRLVK